MKIPEQAKRVFSGVIFDVYQWKQEMFDGTKATFEMLKRSNTIQIIATQGDKILLSHESQPTKKDFISLLGGRQEENETELKTAKREFLEETGMVSDNWELLKVYEPVHKIEWSIHLFVARNCKKVKEPELDSGEKIEIMKVDFDEFIDVALSEKFWGREIVEDVLRLKLEPEKLQEFRKKIFS